MKKHDASVIKKGILLSLVLLSPTILAATENLNFNYTRADTLSLVPKLGLQAKACHSLGDPVDISFKLGSLNPAPVIMLTIKGKTYTKSYSVFIGEKGKTNSRADNTSFSVPFDITKNGSASGTSPVSASIPGQLSFNDPFCFSEKRMANLPLTEGYIPLIEGDAKYGKDYERFCHKNVATQDDVWGGDPRTTPMPDIIKEKGEKYWTSQLFYMTLTNKPAHNEIQWLDFNRKADDDDGKKIVSEMNNYVLPIKHQSAQPGNTVLNYGDFSFNLSNRDITELKVFVDSGYGIYKWEWTASTDNPNILNLKYTNPVQIPVISPMPNNPAAPTVLNDSNPLNLAKNDPYVKNDFYARDDFYKGTLAGKGTLNQKYQDYIQNIVPLSLPPDSDGQINLVNTDSLTFSLRQAANSSHGFMQLSVYGQPMQFGPLKYGNKVVATAMQVRNACY